MPCGPRSTVVAPWRRSGRWLRERHDDGRQRHGHAGQGDPATSEGDARAAGDLGPNAADDPMLVFDLTDQVRETIQQTLYSLLMQRKSVFL